ncbi:hypothetical protein KFL_001640050 [Klebsormidium nitens]|uniref:E3 ubiquitin-protein ligase CHFR n=1 Tax=Klebsormidium nitens TaxID=105231 RepID=A0A0U9HNV1_KLENI|nr:hypothetical protein KFL_001640050 [Klebsormidium nitens]|eukprot:GAQ83830.1 hypothetical protein KFL_001640050 [Klebsormidium nitens]
MASASVEPSAGCREREQNLAALAEDTQEPDIADEEGTMELPQPQAQETKAWGRLASLDPGKWPDIILADAEHIIGRKHAGDNPKVSRQHCRLLKDALEGAQIENWSSTGLQLNGSSIEKGRLVKMADKDTITLGVPEAGCPQYIFLVTETKKRTHEEASQSEASAQPASPSRASSLQTGSSMQGGTQTSINGSPLKRLKGIELSEAEKSEKLECGICHDIWHNCVSTIPCLHTFCAACLSGWVKRSNTCPKCRGQLTAVSRNRDLNALVEDFLKENPDKQRDPEDLAQADKENIFDKDPFPLPVADRGDVDNSDEYDSDADNSDDDLQENLCPQCPPAQRGGFTCAPNQAHLWCAACHNVMPNRGLPTQRCHWCQQPGCDLYFRSLPPPLDGLPNECTGHESMRLKKLNARTWNVLPVSSFSSNQVEQEVLRQYLVEHQKTVQDAVQESLGKVETGDWDFPRDHIQPTGPIGTPLPADLAHDSPLCGICSDRVVGGLLYKYREGIQAADLPAPYSTRPDCWWGWECRTQRHKVDHATRLNHVCGRTRRTAAGSQ